MNALTQKDIRITITLADPNTRFPGSNSNVLVLYGLRVSLNAIAVKNTVPQVTARIYQMTPEQIQALTVIFVNKAPNLTENTILIEVNNGNGFHKFFEGGITWAWPEFNETPEVPFFIMANIGYQNQTTAAQPTTFPHSISIANAVQAIATKMGYTLTVDGVSGVLKGGMYLTGTLKDQLEEIQDAAHIDLYYSTAHKHITITPAHQGVSKASGYVLQAPELLRWPALDRGSVTFQSLYNPIFAEWQSFTVKSVVPNANGLWTPTYMTHELQTQLPGGAWCTTIRAVSAN